MSDMYNQGYLLKQQYHNSRNLNARIQLHERFSTNPVDWQRWVFEQLRIPTGGRVLELGCGPGTLWVKNRDRIPTTWQITLSDFSAGMLKDAQEKLAHDVARFHFTKESGMFVAYGDEAVEG